MAELGPQHNIPQHLDGRLKAPAVHTRCVQESVPGALAVADASILLQQLQDLVLAAELGSGVKCQLLQVMGDSRGEGHLIPAKIFGDVFWGRSRNAYLDPESMATPTVQNWPNFCSEATLIPFSRRVTLVSEEGVAVR